MSVISVTLMSQALAGPVPVKMILPDPGFGGEKPAQFYGSGRKYQVLWLLHGGNCDSSSWMYYTNLVRHVKGRPVIVVMPEGGNSDFANHPQFADGLRLTDYFFEELMPFVCGWFPVSAKPEDHFLAGYSMGAAAAWMMGLLHPERFGGIAPFGSGLKDYTYLEPYRDWSADQFRRKALENPVAFPAGYGDPKSGIHTKEVNMICKYPSVGAFLDSCEHTHDRFKERACQGRLPRVYLACDSGERSYGQVQKFVAFAEKAGAGERIEFRMTDRGVKEYDFCDMALPGMLDYFQII